MWDTWEFPKTHIVPNMCQLGAEWPARFKVCQAIMVFVC
jgi:hypothetical protein